MIMNLWMLYVFHVLLKIFIIFMNFQLSMVSHAYKRSNMLKHGYLTLQRSIYFHAQCNLLVYRNWLIPCNKHSIKEVWNLK